MKRWVKYAALTLFVVVPLLVFAPGVVLLYGLCGAYDVSRNRPLTGETVKRYFLGNGMLTWLLSPFNVLLDLISLPYINKGIYRLEDLPGPYREEIADLIKNAEAADLVGKLEEKTRGVPRTMIFFKWYGSNVDTSVPIPAFHRPYRFVRTIGVSVFNKRESTSKHFGPFRATLRVLYNLNEMEDRSAFIEVGAVKNHWRDQKLFIFDDTLQHQSFNESDKPRYCLFVDILRPSLLPVLPSVVVSGIRVALKGANSIFYKNWKVLQG